jgi:cytochrome P450
MSRATATTPPRVRVTPLTYWALIDRRRAVGMFVGVAAKQRNIAELRIAGRPVWLVSNPAWAREVMVDNGRKVGKGDGVRVLRLVLGNGLLTNEDAISHKRNRRLINPAFSSSQLRKYSEVMVAAAKRADTRWRSGRVVDIADEMQLITLDVVGRTLLGDDTDKDAKAITDAIETVVKRFGLAFVPKADKLFASNLPVAVKMRNAIAAMRGTVERIVREHGAQAVKSDDVVTALLTATEDGNRLSEEQVLDETLTLLLAGFETTANALAWTWWLLHDAPDAAAQLRAELDAVLGDADPTYDDLPRLPYVAASSPRRCGCGHPPGSSNERSRSRSPSAATRPHQGRPS